MLWTVFFFHAMSPGCWNPVLTNLMTAKGLAAWVPLAFLTGPVCALVSPLIGGAVADQRIPADRLFAWSSLAGGILLAAAFATMQLAWHPLWFISLLGLAALAGGPSWGLLATISLTGLPDGERKFPLVRLGGTIGWMAGGLVVSFVLAADTSVAAGYAGAVMRLLAGGLAFWLPHTPPLGGGLSWKSRLGLDAFGLLRQRDHLVFFATTALFSIPLSALYMYGPEFLRVLGDEHPAGTMTIAQVLEIAAMMGVGALMARYRIKVVLLWAIGLSVLRFGMSAWAGVNDVIGWHIAGIALHGVCYTLYFITAQVFLDRRVEPGMKGRAQGLLALVSGGAGPLLGTLLCGWMRRTMVTETGDGWVWFWAALAAMIGVCFVCFAVWYRGLAVPAGALPRPGR
ncbi:MAG: MFS transporter [Akkermansiaceae bacterium]|nr:MFS transporter [Akkermansiaceae bacterium]